MRSRGTVLLPIEGAKKLEGVALAPDGESLLAVDEPDDRATPSGLHGLVLPETWRHP